MNGLFSSAYTSKGFLSLEKETYPPDCFTYILKGYPAEAKKRLFQKIISESENELFVQTNYRREPELVYSEQDKFCIKDGTYPYFRDVSTYGVSDKIIDLSAYQKNAELKNQSSRVSELMSLIKKEERRCERFLLSCSGIVNDCKRLDKDNLDTKKLNRYISKLWRRYGEKPTGKVGMQYKYFASVLTESGTVRSYEPFCSECKNVIVINDWSGAAADMIIDKIRLYALSCGFDVITCVDILFPDDIPEHIIIPAIGLGIYRERSLTSPCFTSYKRIHSRRFMLKETSDCIRNRISFSKKAYTDLINESVYSLKKLKILNEELDGIYLENFDMELFLKSAMEMIYSGS